jgi:transcription termination/antitermination protein NusA
LNAEFINALKCLEKDKNIPFDTLICAIEDALSAAYKKNFSTLENAAIEINRYTGDMKVVMPKTVVDKVKDPQTEITLAQAKKIKTGVAKGDIVDISMAPGDFGRIAAQTAKQVILQRIREAERDIVYDDLVKREGDVVSGTMQRYDQKNIIIELGKVEGVLPQTEQVSTDHFRHGERLKGYVIKVEKGVRCSQVIISRTDPRFIKRLFEMEVPEIAKNLIEIVAVAREPGYRSKVAVRSHELSIDAVGACVGPRGARVQSVVDELRGEKIDIVNWNKDPVFFISNALSPAKVTKVNLNTKEKSALVLVLDTQLSLAIGKDGQNARLAAKLTGWKVDIKTETQYKEYLEEEKNRLAEEARKVEEEKLKKAQEESEAKKAVEAAKKAEDDDKKARAAKIIAAMRKAKEERAVAFKPEDIVAIEGEAEKSPLEPFITLEELEAGKKDRKKKTKVEIEDKGFKKKKAVVKETRKRSYDEEDLEDF